MKKRLITILLTLCLAIGSIFAFAGCGNDPVTQKEFAQLVIDSYETFYEDHNSYEVFDDITITASQTNTENYSFDWEYTPDGATTSTTVTYTEVQEEKATVNYSVKRINGELFFTAKTVVEEVEITYDSSDSNTEPLTAEYFCEKEVNNWVFGVENGVYYVKNEKIYQEGEQTLGQAETTKSYMIFENADQYKDAIMVCMMAIDEDLLGAGYTLFTSGELESFMMFLGTVIKIDKEDDVYSIGYNLTVPVLNEDDKTGGMYEVEYGSKYGKEGLLGYNQKVLMEQNNVAFCMNLKLDVEYTSNVTAETNAFDGYTLDANLDYTDFYVF